MVQGNEKKGGYCDGAGPGPRCQKSQARSSRSVETVGGGKKVGLGFGFTGYGYVGPFSLVGIGWRHISSI